MTQERNLKLVEKIRAALEARRYEDFVALFALDGVYQLPFALAGNVARFVGVAEIRDRFNEIAQSPLNRRYALERVQVQVHQTLDPDVVVLELSLEGKLNATGQPIALPSSVAVVSFEGEKIKHYRDYPNSAGLAEATGLLAHYAASLTK